MESLQQHRPSHSSVKHKLKQDEWLTSSDCAENSSRAVFCVNEKRKAEFPPMSGRACKVKQSLLVGDAQQQPFTHINLFI